VLEDKDGLGVERSAAPKLKSKVDPRQHDVGFVTEKSTKLGKMYWKSLHIFQPQLKAIVNIKKPSTKHFVVIIMFTYVNALVTCN
jgi:hypothetical protein